MAVWTASLAWRVPQKLMVVLPVAETGGVGWGEDKIAMARRRARPSHVFQEVMRGSGGLGSGFGVSGSLLTFAGMSLWGRLCRMASITLRSGMIGVGVTSYRGLRWVVPQCDAGVVE